MLNLLSGRVAALTNEFAHILVRNYAHRASVQVLFTKHDQRMLKVISEPTWVPHAPMSSRTNPTVDGSQPAAVDEQQGGFFKRLINKIGFIDNSRLRLRVSSAYLYESVADSINYAEFYMHFKMPNTFNTWFLITELHVWMLLVRAMAEGPEKDAAGRYMRNCIVESMWNDVSTRAKQLSANNPSAVRPQIQLLSEQFQAALLTYDEGINGDDKVLAAALWRRFLSSKCDDYEMLELLVKYVRKQMAMLDEKSRYDFAIKPKVKWLPLVEKASV
ncbi:ubiquinol-cytochrome-c reductase complex assembly factor 1 [Topomyia yanbarensis]|uniref:ubiquinol-cytochrome-c reductase complex assembly factor 1 n=1 Tax=Topomyia yanbarensis TaxID=2498891 RepID=UPI00273C81A4|nr:ubiquinol-cytochrome-c reductase complex assembly factor 1 [Topomyia yanbarensis]